MADYVDLNFGGGAPSVNPDSGSDSVVFDYSQGYPVAVGAPGSLGPDGKIITGIQALPGEGSRLPAKQPVSIGLSSLTVVGGCVAVVLLLALMGGRR